MNNIYHESEYGKIYNTDCVKGIEKYVESESIDFILTDPPFNVDLDYDEHDDNMDNNLYQNWCEKWVDKCYDSLKDGGYIMIFSSDKCIYPILKSVYNSNFDYQHLIKWYKPNSQGSLPGTVFFNRVELGVVGTKGDYKAQSLNKCKENMYQDIIKIPNRNTHKDKDLGHPCPRPIELYERIIKTFTDEGDVIMDLFLGSGTCIRACKNSDRYCIGFEKSKKYCEISRERLLK